MCTCSMQWFTLRGLGDPEYDDSELPRLGGGPRPLIQGSSEFTYVMTGNQCLNNLAKLDKDSILA